MKKIIFLITVTLLFSSCATSTLYSWHNYEDLTYQYHKNPTEKLYQQVDTEYTNLINKQTGTRNTPPPGLYAEYGYFLYKSGKIEEGLKCFKMEIMLYPESEKYISRIIKQLEQ